MASKTAEAIKALSEALVYVSPDEDIDELAKKVVAKLKKAQAGIARLEVELHEARQRITELESRETSKLG